MNYPTLICPCILNLVIFLKSFENETIKLRLDKKVVLDFRKVFKLSIQCKRMKKTSDTKYSGCKPFVFNFTSVSIIRNKCHKRSHAFISITPIQAFYDRTFFLTCSK